MEDWIASFYIFDAHFFKADVDFEKISNENYLVCIEGEVCLDWETVPNKDFRYFKIKNTIPFNGIISEIDDEIAAFKVAAKYLDTKELKWLPKEETSSGVDNWLTY